MERFFRTMAHAAIVSVPFATAIALMVAFGHLTGFCHPNVIPEAGETYLGFYSILWFGTALPMPILVGTLAAIYGMVRGDWSSN